MFKRNKSKPSASTFERKLDYATAPIEEIIAKNKNGLDFFAWHGTLKDIRNLKESELSNA